MAFSQKMVLAAVALGAAALTLQGCMSVRCDIGELENQPCGEKVGQLWDNAKVKARLAKAKLLSGPARAAAKLHQWAEAAHDAADSIVDKAKVKAGEMKAKASGLLAAADQKVSAAKDLVKQAAGKAGEAAKSAAKIALGTAILAAEKAKKEAGHLVEKAGEAVEHAKALKDRIKAKAAEAKELLVVATGLDKAKIAAKQALAAVSQKSAALVKSASDNMAKVAGAGPAAIAAAKGAWEAAKTNAAETVAAAGRKATAAAEKHIKGEEAAEAAAGAAKALSIAGGVPAELFMLIPDEDEIGVKSNRSGVVYYIGMASLSFVTFGFFALAVRKISLNSGARGEKVSGPANQEDIPFVDEMGPCE